jgi:predicted O-linked N-acetylglucosamine transferase (SPINDLY family)
MNEYQSAIECFNVVLMLKPESEYLRGIVAFLKNQIGEWGRLEEDKEILINLLENKKRVTSPFPALSILEQPEDQLKAAQIFTNSEYPPNDSLGPIEKYNNPKIKIAYFSADFSDHPVSYLTAELFEIHDRNQFEVYAFSLKQAETSPMRERLISGFDHFIDVSNKTDVDIAALARSLKIDIAIDLGGHTQDAKTGVFAYRAAAVQVNYLGFAGTMGASYMDYIIADQIVIPQECKDFYLEKKVYMPNSYMVDDSKRLPSSKQFSRADFGLPKDGVIFCCFNNSYKFNPPRIASFAKILSNVPNSILWVSENNPSFRKNLVAEFAKNEISGSRIIFAGRVDKLEDHLARYRLADLFLDTGPYNAHTTALDSLKAGVPIISLAGKTYASRASASFLTAIGLPELIVHSEEEFVSLASKLGQDAKALQSLKEKLVANYQTMPLFNSQLFCKHLESAYKQMYSDYMNGLPPSDIRVSQQTI